MTLSINEWTNEEAQKNFERIEDLSNREWFDIDWKEQLNFADTTTTNNTIQKAISGLANTFGGAVVIGFNDTSRALHGVDEKSNIENEISEKIRKKVSPLIPIFKTKYYDYKGKKILVIFVANSKKPIFCDNGTAYYRDQSRFLPMTYDMLNSKFRNNYEDEKYLYLVKNDLRRLKTQIEMLLSILDNNGLDDTPSYYFGGLSKNLVESGDRLYNLYKENNLLGLYDYLMNGLLFHIAGEGTGLRIQKRALVSLHEHITNLLTLLEKLSV